MSEAPKQINVPIGTLVNGIPIKKHAALQAKVADQALRIDALEKELEKAKTTSFVLDVNKVDIKKLKEELVKHKQEPAQPEIPDWIAPGKRLASKKYPDGRKISDVKDGCVHFADSGTQYIQFCMEDYAPFTPPPCPELPKCCHWISLYGGAVHLLADVFEMESEMDAIKEYRDWKLKWGN